MAAKIEAKPLKEAVFSMEGISRNQLEQHYTLYQGYVNKVNEIHGKLETVDRSTANQAFSDLRELKVELTFAWDGVKLHELYFENLGGAGSERSADLSQAMDGTFGSWDKFIEDWKASGIAARGWVVLAVDLENGQLFSYIADAHNLYGVWNAIPVLIMDTYEHAYMIDYGVRRPPYIDAFVNNIDWAVVSTRYAKAQAAVAAVK